jgi:protein gp37
MNRTKIEWTDWTWNPVTGCLHGCPYCYARRIAARFGKTPEEKEYQPLFHPERLDKPLRVKKPSKIFVCSMADLLGDWVPDSWIRDVITAVRFASQHTFQFLTKNPKRYKRFNWPPNAWLGATVVNQAAMPPARICDCYRICFLSIEPMLGPIQLTWKPDWLIIGAQTGPGAKPPERQWVEDLTTQAAGLGVAVFHKPNLGPGFDLREFPE